MLPGQANCKAFSIRINTFTLIHVKQPEICEPFACIFTDYVQYGRGCDVFVRNQCKVTTNLRKARQLVEFRHFTERHFSQNQFENEDWPVETEGFRQFGVDCADEADFTPFPLDARGLTRVQRRMFTRSESERIQSTGEAQHCFNISLDVEEVDSIATLRPAFRQTAAADNTGQHRLLLQAFKLADKAQATFEQAHAVLLTVQVVLQRLDQTGPQRRTHGGHIVGDRIGQATAARRPD